MRLIAFLFLLTEAALAQEPMPSPTATELPGLTIIGNGGVVSDVGPQDRRSESTLGGIVPFAAPTSSPQAQSGQERQEARDSLQVTCECNCPPPQVAAGVAGEADQAPPEVDSERRASTDESTGEAPVAPETMGPPAPAASP